MSRLRQRQARIHFSGCFRMTNRQTGLEANEKYDMGRKREEKKESQCKPLLVGNLSSSSQDRNSLPLGHPQNHIRLRGGNQKEIVTEQTVNQDFS